MGESSASQRVLLVSRVRGSRTPRPRLTNGKRRHYAVRDEESADQRGLGVHAESFVELADVLGCGVNRQPEMGGDLLSAMPLEHPVEDLGGDDQSGRFHFGMVISGVCRRGRRVYSKRG